MNNAFISIVDNAIAKFQNGLTLEKEYLYYEVERAHPNHYSLQELLNGIYGRIKELLKPDPLGSIGRNELLILQSYFALAHYYKNEPLYPYYNIVNKLIEITSADIRFKPFTESKNWYEAVGLLKGLLKKDEINHASLNIRGDKSVDIETNEEYIFRTFHNKENQIAKAGLFFEAKGYNLTFDIKGLRLDSKSQLEWGENLKSNFEKIGGECVIASIFEHLKGCYDSQVNRYLVRRQVGNISTETKPAFPYGYLLNLAVQFIGRKEDCNNPEMIFNTIFNECTKYATLEDVQPYSFLDGIFYNNYSTIDNITKSVLYDSIYSFPQLNYSYLPFILSTTFNWIDKEAFKKTYSFTIDDYIEICNYILSHELHSNVRFDLQDFPFEKETTEKILDSLSHLDNQVNTDFNFPEDYFQVNFNRKPLIKTKGNYYLADKNYCAPSFVDCLAYLCEKLYKSKEFWSRLGFAIEDTIKEKFRSKGISFKSGMYRYAGKDWECDFVLEDSERIVFIETKNKTLTTYSRSGSQLDILSDLLCSIVSEMKQTGRHKLVLEKEQIIRFDNGEEINLQGRVIERVGISYDDYGFIQSRIALLEFLRNLSTINIIVSDAVDSKIKKSIEHTLKDFKDNLHDIFDNDPNYGKKIFFDCWFISLPMLFLMIDNSASSEALIKEIITLKFIGSNSQDFYFDYDYVKKTIPQK